MVALMVCPEWRWGDTIKMTENRLKSGLTAASVSRAKPKDKPYKLSDRDGLYLLVEPTAVVSGG
jgi:hypothetical protein